MSYSLFNDTSRVTLLLAASAALYSGSALAADGQPMVLSTQYAGADRVAVRWESTLGNGDLCGYQAAGNGYYSSRGEYAVFARTPGGQFELVWDLRNTSDRMWFGAVPNLGPDTPVEIQIRQKEFSSESYCENSTDSIALVDVSDIDNPPSYDHAGDVVISNFQIQQSDPSEIFAPQYWAEYEVQDWAQNITDNDGETQPLLSNFVYSTPFGLSVNNQSNTGGLTSNLTGSTRSVFDVNNIDYRDGLSVLQACNIAKNGEGEIYFWVGACTEEIPVIVSAGPSAVGANNVPSFVMANALSVGADYSLQEHLNWATNLVAGDNATASSSLRFHTLWVTNSALYEVAPWISYPSGSLRFKFKEGVSGTSRMYVSLADWDANSPENIVARFDAEYHTDLSPDHSMIQYVELSVGDGTNSSRSGGARGTDLSNANILDADSLATEGGGGALGLLSLSFLMVASRRKR